MTELMPKSTDGETFKFPVEAKLPTVSAGGERKPSIALREMREENETQDAAAIEAIHEVIDTIPGGESSAEQMLPAEREARSLADQALAMLTPELRAIIESGRSFKLYYEEVVQELAANEGLRNKYREIVLNNNPEALRQNSLAQLDSIKSFYEAHSPDQQKPLVRVKRSLQKLIGREPMIPDNKVKQFYQALSAMGVVRSDQNGEAYDEFLAPDLSSKAISFETFDPYIRASQYVYASLSGIRHHMSVGERVWQIDPSSVNENTQLVMQDIVTINTRDTNSADRGHTIEKYMKNCYDLETGLVILSFYLASVFESPEEASTFLGLNNARDGAEGWQQPPISKNFRYMLPPAQMEQVEARITQLPSEERQKAFGDLHTSFDAKAEEILGKMGQVYDETGIEPPLSLEVRLLNRAKIQK